jgi:hypothetical protein
MAGMTIRQKLAKRRVQLMLLLVIVMACLPLQAAGAQDSYQTGVVPAGETLQGSQFLFAPQINIEGTVDGDVFAISQDVTLKGEIKGSLFVLSTKTTIDGQLEGDLFSANTRLTLQPESSIGRSAYILTGIIDMLPNREIGRDLYLIGLSGEISGTVGRYQRAHLGTIEILDMLIGENGLLRPLLPPGFRLPWSAINNLAARPAERALYFYSAVTGLGFSALGLPTTLQPRLQTTSIDSAALGGWLLARLRTFAPLLLIGLLLLWLFPRFLQGSTGHLRTHPLNSFGIGVVVFFVSFGVAMLALALIAMLGLFFAMINYWDLAMMIWGAGLGGISVALALFGLALGYLSKIIVAYLLGALLLGQLPGIIWGRRFWMLLLGLLILVLLLSIPFLGWVLSILTIMFGLGAIFLQLRQRRQPGDDLLQDLTGPSVAKESESQAQLAIEEAVSTGVTIEPEAISEVEHAEEVSEETTEATTALGDEVEITSAESANTDAEIESDAPAVADKNE